MPHYEVIVSNIGRVAEGHSPATVRRDFTESKALSRRGYGRYAYESVSLFRDGELIDSYEPPVRPGVCFQHDGKMWLTGRKEGNAWMCKLPNGMSARFYENQIVTNIIESVD